MLALSTFVIWMTVHLDFWTATRTEQCYDAITARAWADRIALSDSHVSSVSLEQKKKIRGEKGEKVKTVTSATHVTR